jgi:cobaltochelatase CobN
METLAANSAETALTTKRLVMGHVVMCRGCCCGEVNKGKPEVPVEMLKQEWRERGLMKNIQLTISGCLGPCDISNVVSISCSGSQIWLGNLRDLWQYNALLEWASSSKTAGKLLALPAELELLRFDPFRPMDCLGPSLSVGERL